MRNQPEEGHSRSAVVLDSLAPASYDSDSQARASELRYGIIPELEKQLPSEGCAWPAAPRAQTVNRS